MPTLVLEEQITPPARNGNDPEDGIPWSVLKLVATGCEQDYLAGDRSGAMFREAPNSQAGSSDLPDPVQSLKDGVPVLYYDDDDRTFERRVLKADDELHFIYVLVSMQASQMEQPSGKTPTAPLMSVPLSHIRHVYVMDEALHICEEHGVHDPNLKLDSTVVVYYDMDHEHAAIDLEQEMPPLQKLFIFMAAPQQHLPQMLQACSEHLDFRKAHHATKSIRMRLDQVALQESNKLFDRGAEVYGFSLTFRNDNSERELTLPGDRFEGVERDTLERMLADIERKLHTEYRVLDTARVMYVLRDAALLRRSVTFMSPDIFQHRLDDFIRDGNNVDKILPTDEAFRHACNEVDDALGDLETSKEFGERRYTEASCRAVLSAMKQLLSLEGEHARMEHEIDEDLESAYMSRQDSSRGQTPRSPPGSARGKEAAGLETQDAPAVSAGEAAAPPGNPKADAPADDKENLASFGDENFPKRSCHDDCREKRQCGGADGCTLQ